MMGQRRSHQTSDVRVILKLLFLDLFEPLSRHGVQPFHISLGGLEFAEKTEEGLSSDCSLSEFSSQRYMFIRIIRHSADAKDTNLLDQMFCDVTGTAREGDTPVGRGRLQMLQGTGMSHNMGDAS